MATTAKQMRTWSGPALFSFGFRPFFLGAALWAVLSMGLWVSLLSGAIDLPIAFDMVSWHAHELLFGYLGAVLAGFMMTAVPNWTGRMPIVGRPLAGLFALWLLGRLAMAISGWLPAWVVATMDLVFLATLVLVMAREIMAGRNWRNLMVVALASGFLLANGLFHLDLAHNGFAARGLGLRLGLGCALMMIALIGGRIIPSFTRNWLVRQQATPLPTPPMQRFDKLSLLIWLAALLTWTIWPDRAESGLLLMLSGVVHLIRLSRWAGLRTLAEPLVWILHLAYAFLPAGALMQGLAILRPGQIDPGTAQHLWMAGGIGAMTLAVMTRASLGHTGQALTAGPGTLAIYLLLIASVLLRLLAGMLPAQADMLHHLSGTGWMLAFGGFALFYGRLLLRPRPVA